MNKLYILFFFWAFTVLGSGTNNNNKTAGTSVAIGTGSTSSGNLLVLALALDNRGTTDGDLGDVTSVTDDGGSTWVKAVEFTNGQTAALAGATVSIWYSLLTATSGTLTANFSGSVTAKGWQIRGFSIAGGNSVAIETSTTLANDAADAGSLTLSGMVNREHLIIRACAVENNAITGTISTNYLNLCSNYISCGTTGGSVSTNMWMQAEYRIITSTSETTDPTTGAVDQASVMVAFYEFIPSSPTRKLLPLKGVGYFKNNSDRKENVFLGYKK